jgi:hypothetical protein
MNATISTTDAPPKPTVRGFGGSGPFAGISMRLVGQLSNLSPTVERVLAPFPKGAPPKRRCQAVATPLPSKRHGNRVVERAVVRALADGAPRKLADIRSAAERLIGQPVSIESVSWCLLRGSRKETPLFVRPSHGFYQLASQT